LGFVYGRLFFGGRRLEGDFRLRRAVFVRGLSIGFSENTCAKLVVSKFNA